MLGKRPQIQRTTSMSQLRLPPHTRVMEEVQFSPSPKALCNHQPKSCTNAPSKETARLQEGSSLLKGQLTHLQIDDGDDGVTTMKMDGVFSTSMKMDDEQSTPAHMNHVDVIHEEILMQKQALSAAPIHEEILMQKQALSAALPSRVAQKPAHVHPQAINWGHHMRSLSLPDKQETVESFLHACFSCKMPLRPGRDIYMYRGDVAFCTEECRLEQILCDERLEKKGGVSIPTANTKTSRKAVSAVAA